jgi:hypothetical protein
MFDLLRPHYESELREIREVGLMFAGFSNSSDEFPNALYSIEPVCFALERY